jgi:hypothetical protein
MLNPKSSSLLVTLNPKPDLFEEAKMVFLRAFGKDHHFVATTCTHILSCNITLGNFEEALVVAREVLRIYSNMGESHADKAQHAAMMVEGLIGEIEVMSRRSES